ncbi:MAG: ABC transporter substrate-binding protein [Holophagaceae bacterium]|nr:ABC transporter substrate-binding protein [Holophagaceae bacterium]
MAKTKSLSNYGLPKVILLYTCFFAIFSFFLFPNEPNLALVASTPKRVVSQTIGTDDLLLALAAPNQIAALCHLAHDPLFAPDVNTAKQYPTLKGSSAEDILRFRPDLVLMSSFSPPDSISVLKKSGVKIYILDKYESLEDVYTSIKELGNLLGQKKKAESLIATCRARVESLTEALKGVKPVRVLSAGVYPYISGANTSFQDLCDRVGAINSAATAGINGVVPIPTEKILSWKIDFLVGPTEHLLGEKGPKLVDRLREISPYRFLQAHKQGKVIEIPSALFAATSHHRISAYEMLARALHPERFAPSIPAGHI